MVGENCEESRQLWQREAISYAGRWQSISPGNTAGKKKKRRKRGKKKEKRKKSRGMKERKLGRELEMKTKRGIQCSESP